MEEKLGWQAVLYSVCFFVVVFLFFKDFIQKDTEREAETQAEGETGSS